MKLRRMTSTRWFWYFWPFAAKDEWRFEYAGHKYAIVNRWTGPTVLLQNGHEIARRAALFNFSSSLPFIVATVPNADCLPVEIRVFIEALLTVKASVSIDGERNEEGLI